MPSISGKGSCRKPYKSILKKFLTTTKSPEDFLSIQQSKSDDIRKLLKKTYDLTVTKDIQNKTNHEVIPELVVDDLDEEQVWQLVELRNNVVWPQFLKGTSKLLALQPAKFQINYIQSKSESSDIEKESEDEQQSLEENIDSDDFEENESRSEEDFGGAKMKKALKPKGKSSIVDDQFFKLSEMEEFLAAEDEKEMNKQKGKLKDDFGISFFDEHLDEEDGENIEYKDFFEDDAEDDSGKLGQKQIKKGKKEIDYAEETNGNEEPSESEEENEDEESPNNITKSDDSDGDSVEDAKDNDKPKSSFEERQDRLTQRIKDYEEEILGDKPWQLKGEVHATNRPQNSLLEEILEFEATTRPAPVITEDTTLRLEDIIRQRIKDQAWDDVELKVKPLNSAREYRKQLVLDQEKSKESLAQIYEKQYQQEIEKLNPNAEDAKEEEPKSHKEIKEMMRSLFIKLDALSNFHFTPKPVAPEPKIITNTPAVNMEEVAPVAVSSAKLLAPEEIRRRAKGDVLGNNERNKTDKNRERRQKKQKQRAIHKALENRDIQKQKLGIKLSQKEEQAKATKSLTKSRNVVKGSVSNDTGAMKSSKTFFSKLQETTSLQNKNTKKTKKPDANTLSAKKLKL